MFLSIITRHMEGREKSFQKLLDSMKEFDHELFQHVIICDTGKGGIEHANCLFEKAKMLANGDYIYMMDDDDFFIHYQFPQVLNEYIQSINQPDIVMIRFLITEMELPQPWGDFYGMKCGTIGTPNFVLRREVWFDYIKNFCGPRGGDYRLIESLQQRKNWNIAWFDSYPIGTTKDVKSNGMTDLEYEKVHGK